MCAFIVSRRNVVACVAMASVAVAAGCSETALAAVAPAPDEAASPRMIAAWVRLRPDAGAVVRIACLDSAGRALREWPEVRLEACDATLAAPPSAWGQAQQAGEIAQRLAMAAIAQEWGVPRSECEIGPGAIAHPPSRRAMRHVVWLDLMA
jgi:hypothetical protein